MGFDDDLANLVTTRGDHLLRIAYQLSHDRGAAEDIVQEALFEVCRSWRGRDSSPEYLHAYVRRAVVNEFLKKRRRNTPQATVAEAPEPAGAHFEESLAERDALWQALLTLSVAQRAVLVLRYYEDLPDAEIATIMSCRRATVRSHAARGLAALRQPNAADIGVAAGLGGRESPAAEGKTQS
jgi:RNA polymerase sigma-70 factor (sigma-E family)